MIHYFEGTVFNAPVKTIVNTVNCMGFMGAGIALEFKLRYPAMNEDYKIKCEKVVLAIFLMDILQEEQKPKAYLEQN